MNLSDLKSAFASKDKLTSDLSAAQAQIAQLTSDLASARAEATAEKTRADGLQAQMDEAQKQIDQLTGKVSSLEESAQTVEKAAAGKMTEAMASIGISPAQLPAAVDVAEGNNELSAEDHARAMREEQDPAKRTIYFREHRKQILHAKPAAK